MLKAVLFDDDDAEAKNIPPGWWAIDEADRPLYGPYPSREAALVAIAKNTGEGLEEKGDARGGATR